MAVVTVSSGGVLTPPEGKHLPTPANTTNIGDGSGIWGRDNFALGTTAYYVVTGNAILYAKDSQSRIVGKLTIELPHAQPKRSAGRPQQ